MTSSRSGMPEKKSTRQATLDSLRAAQGAVDGYGIAKLAKVSPLQASRALERLVFEGLASKQDDVDGLTDPSATFRAVSSS